jgi:hypothetical protein
MRGQERRYINHFPLTLALSLMERGLFCQQSERLMLITKKDCPVKWEALRGMKEETYAIIYILKYSVTQVEIVE